jgi:hypothetical protein
MRGRVVRADGGGLGHTRTVEERVLVRLPDTPSLQRLLQRSSGGAASGPEPADDHVENRSIPDTTGLTPNGLPGPVRTPMVSAGRAGGRCFVVTSLAGPPGESREIASAQCHPG